MKQLHLLINKKSSHYDNGDKTTIEQIESVLTVEQMIGACIFNIMKYQDRKDHKEQHDSDIEKIKSYDRYKYMLECLDVRFKDVIVSDVYKRLGIEWSYR